MKATKAGTSPNTAAALTGATAGETASPGNWQRVITTWRVRPRGHRGGTPARRSHSRQPGLGRVGPSGSEATGWHHYDGAREIITERTLGTTSDGSVEMLSDIGIVRRISS